MNDIIKKIEAEQLKENAPEFNVGDTCFQSVFNHFGKQRKYMKVHSFCFS